MNLKELLSLDFTKGPVPEWSGYTDDAELIAAARRSKSFDDLWTANADTLAVIHPHHSEPNAIDRSSADADLCQHLAFWTGKDGNRIDRLFRQSALMRDKWEDREDYRQYVIATAITRCRYVHDFGVPTA